MTLSRKRHQDGVENLAVRLREAIVLARVGHVDGRHEPTDGITRRRLERLEPQQPGALAHDEDFIPAAEQGEGVDPPDDDV